MPAREDHIRTIFSYSESEREVFPSLDKYMRLIERRLDSILSDSVASRRFMLAGLFLTYRACNHNGRSITTEIEDLSMSEIHLERLRTFAELTNEEIESTSDYLGKLNLSPIWKYSLKLILFGPGRVLYKFVITDSRK